jgi:hypothetical protein
MEWTDADIENFTAWLIEKGEKGIRESLLHDEFGEMQKKLAVQFLDGLDAERVAEQRETKRIALDYEAATRLEGINALHTQSDPGRLPC